MDYYPNYKKPPKNPKWSQRQSTWGWGFVFGVLMVLTPLKAPATNETNTIDYPIAEVEAWNGEIIKNGLAALIGPKSALSARHIVEGARGATIFFENQQSKVIGFTELRDIKTKDSHFDKLANDIIILNLLTPIKPKSPYLSLADTPPKKGDLVQIPKYDQGKIVWEERYISGADSHSAWAGTPKPIYKGILWLNAEKINQGTHFQIGDSGGPWVTMDGKITGVTSRVDNDSFSPNSQTAYAANVKINENSKEITQKNTIAWRPMVVATALLILVWGIRRLRSVYSNQT